MKTLKVLFGAVVAALFAGAVAMAASLPQGMISTSGGNAKSSSVTAAASTVGTAVASTPGRVGGWMVNTSTSYLHVSLSGTTTTQIEAGYFVLYPTADSYGRDRFNFMQGNVVYSGPVYYTGSSSPTSGASKEVGSASVIEFK